MPEHDQLSRIETHLERQDQALQRLLMVMEGDDLDPSKPGIKVRLDRLESFVNTAKWIIGVIIGTIVTAVTTVLYAVVKKN